ncbi:hypothetical protein NMY22_g11295 [Coprinellus aureogranulatus]|nr:hypothetical protein NMY22_g11295 [Coprinellus aureogranulatus]
MPLRRRSLPPTHTTSILDSASLLPHSIGTVIQTRESAFSVHQSLTQRLLPRTPSSILRSPTPGPPSGKKESNPDFVA